MSTLPAEWKDKLTQLAPADAARIERLAAANQTSWLPQEKEVGPFLLFVLGDSLDDISSKCGIPKDIVFLTYLKYNWEDKRVELSKQGNVSVISALKKRTLNYLMLATSSVIDKQVAQVLSGALPAEKCPLIPRSLHAYKLLSELHDEVNKEPVVQQPSTTNVIHAQNVQVNQQLPAAKEPEVDKLHAMKLMAGEKDD